MPFFHPVLFLSLSNSLKQVILCSYGCRYINLETIRCNKFSQEINWTFCKKRIPTPSDGQCAGCDLPPPLTVDISPPSFSYCHCLRFANRHGYFLLCSKLWRFCVWVDKSIPSYNTFHFRSYNVPFHASYILSSEHFFFLPFFCHHLFHHLQFLYFLIYFLLLSYIHLSFTFAQISFLFFLKYILNFTYSAFLYFFLSVHFNFLAFSTLFVSFKRPIQTACYTE